MSQTTKHLGFLIKNRGEYIGNPETKYYKDNVVQYMNSSFICDPQDYDETTNPLAYVIEPPLNENSELNKGWKIFAVGSDTLAQQAIEEAKRNAINEINNAIEGYAPVQITGDVTNAADEEDITSVNVQGTNVLKLKDKSYNSLVFSGLGRKILRKNMVNGVNTLTQEMMSDANTIYVIQYDFTLGENITVPANCVLEFDGGSISGNKTIIGNNTGIDAGLVKILNTDVTLGGSWNVVEAYPEWFGAKGDGITDDTAPIKLVILYFSRIWFDKKTYKLGSFETRLQTQLNTISSCVYLLERNNISIYGLGTIITTGITTNAVQFSVFLLKNCSNVTIHGLTFIDDTYSIENNTPIIAGIHCINDNINLDIDIKCNNVRYGFRSGVYAEEIINGNSGISYSKIRVNSNVSGYPVSVEYGSHLDITIKTLDSCRALYLCGVDTATVNVTYNNYHTAYSNVLLRNNVNGKGCSNIDLHIVDDKSVAPISGGTYACALNISAYPKTGVFSNVEEVVFENITAYIKLKEGTNTIPFSYDQTENHPIHKYRNIKLIIDDNSGLAETGQVAFGISGIKEDWEMDLDVRCNTTKPVYLGNNKTNNVRLFFHDSTCGICSFSGSNKSNRYKIYNVIARQFAIAQASTEFIEASGGNFINFAYSFLINAINYTYIGRTHGEQFTPTSSLSNGYQFFRGDINKPVWFKGYNSWVESDGAVANVKRSGTFTQKPAAANIYIGFRYFCTDKQTAEGATNGIMIYHKGNDVWVDALGRVVS